MTSTTTQPTATATDYEAAAKALPRILLDWRAAQDALYAEIIHNAAAIDTAIKSGLPEAKLAAELRISVRQLNTLRRKAASPAPDALRAGTPLLQSPARPSLAAVSETSHD